MARKPSEDKNKELLKKAIKQRKERFRKVRRENLTRRVREGGIDDEEDIQTFVPSRQRDTALDEKDLKGEYHHFSEESREADFVGMVVEIYPRGGLVRKSANEYILCEIAEYMWSKNETPVAAGDEAECVFVDDETYEYDGIIIGIRERENVVSVPDVKSGLVYEKILAVNIDLFVVVDSLVDPEIQPSFIDRCLIIGQREGDKTTVLCLNKTDLAEDIPPEIKQYETCVDHLVYTSAVTGEGVEELSELLRNKRGVMAGRSGVGKSSLLNCLCPDLNIDTQPVMKKSGKGTHTTRRYSLYELSNGGIIIDTPGVKEISLINIDKNELTWFFPEFYMYREQCKFSDCTHSHEPQCGVKEAVEAGNILEFRYNNYLRMLETL
ncbi:ribosome small subunit-dependent GTPase A [Planctomycetota bacterium]